MKYDIRCLPSLVVLGFFVIGASPAATVFHGCGQRHDQMHHHFKEEALIRDIHSSRARQFARASFNFSTCYPN